MPRLLLPLLAILLLTSPAYAEAEYAGWWPDPYEVADEEEQAERRGHYELTAEQRRAIHDYLNRHADTNGDGVFNADDIEQFERTGDLELLRDSDLMGGYFGSGDEFIRDGVEHEVNGGRFLRGSRDRNDDAGQDNRLDLFGMRGFLTDAGTYSNPSEEVAGSHYLHWRRQVAGLLPGYIPPGDYSELLERFEREQQEEGQPREERQRPRYRDDDPNEWW